MKAWCEVRVLRVPGEVAVPHVGHAVRRTRQRDGRIGHRFKIILRSLLIRYFSAAKQLHAVNLQLLAHVHCDCDATCDTGE